ncbi:RHS repeat-associated core domain-containing protein [Rhizobium leguminosarum]|uniref:RHS repeat-associated core domain-containing protein n=1 Tax=Rhizobium leguminosarum TaxID=384 RepID=UPI001C98125B|nr:RHS repeat-associated core domain-containing protein [Rhizobium leguminosarum]MBY5625929.1 hypothetical protein [Rhizobium leguminosarum]
MLKKILSALISALYAVQIFASSVSPANAAPAQKSGTNYLFATSTLSATATLDQQHRDATLAGLKIFIRDGLLSRRPLSITVECFNAESTPGLAVDAEQYGASALLLNLTGSTEHPCSSYQVTAAASSSPGPVNAPPAEVSADELSNIAVSVHASDLSLNDSRLGDPAVFVFNSVHGNWTKARSFTSPSQESKRVYATLNEQSQRIISGVIALPSPLQNEPSRSEPSSLAKPLDQVSPLDGYLAIEGIEPDNKGAYGINLPLLLRPSRGAGPSVAVKYSSQGAPGVLGRGWDLSISSIEVRGPAPIYHPGYETEDYLLDGMDLIALDAHGKDIPPLYKGGPIIPRISSERVFRLRNNSSGLIVRRRGTAPSSYFWEVWDPNSHVTRLYGAKFEKSEAAPLIEPDDNGLLRGSIGFGDDTKRAVIGQWALTQEYDSQIARSGSRYHYVKTPPRDGGSSGDCVSTSWDGDCRAALRLDTVEYSRAFGVDADPVLARGETKVRFKWREREQQRFISDGWLGFFRAQEFWLQKIDVLYRPEPGNLWLAAANGDPKLPNNEVLYSSHNFELNDTPKEDPNQACMNNDRVLKAYTVRANALIDGKAEAGAEVVDKSEQQTFTFDYAGEGCTAKWKEPQEFSPPIGELGIDAPGGKLGFPADLVRSLGFGLLQSQSLLGTGRTEETGASLFVGVGPADNLFAKPVSGGVKGGATFTKSEGNSTLVDITGDGIDDILYRVGNKLRYCAGRRSPENKYELSYERCGTIEGLNGLSDFAVSSSSTRSAGAEGFAPGGIFGAVGFNDSSNNTYVYFTQADGDGLIDLVAYGQIYYGQGEEYDPGKKDAEGNQAEGFVRFAPRSALTPPIPGAIAETKLKAHLPAPLRNTIREIESSLAETSRKLKTLEYSQTTLAWESPLDGVVSISGLFELGESAREGESRGALPEDFDPAKFEALPGEVKPYADYVVDKANCQKWSDDDGCHQKFSDPFSPSYEPAPARHFNFIATPPARVQISLDSRSKHEATPCTDSEAPDASGRLDLANLKFKAACQPTSAELDKAGSGKFDQSKLITVRAGDVIYITYSVHPHFSKWMKPAAKIKYETVSNDPVFNFLKYGKLTSGGTKKGIEAATGCRWKDPIEPVFAKACILAALNRYEFDLRAGALTSAPGESVILAGGTERTFHGKFTIPAGLTRAYNVYIDLLGVPTTESDADKTVLPSVPFMRLDGNKDCGGDLCTVNLSTICLQPQNIGACAAFLTDSRPYVLALRLTVEHRLSVPVEARNISSLIASLHWLEAPAVVSRFVEKPKTTPILEPKEDKKTIVYIPVRMGDPDIEYARVEDGVFKNPDVHLNEDSDTQPEKINFAKIQKYESLNVEMARKRQTIDLCNFAEEIAYYFESHFSPNASPFAEDYSGYWRKKIDVYSSRCSEARQWLDARAFTNGDRPQDSVPNALRLPQLLQNLSYEEQIASAETLLERVLATLAMGEELLTDDARLSRRGYRLPAKVNPLDCWLISNAAKPVDKPISSNQDECAYRILANFAMQDFEDVMPSGDAQNLRKMLAGFANSKMAAFELQLTATVNGVPVSFRELSGSAASNDQCEPKAENRKTCLGNYGTREPVQGYYFPSGEDDVFQRITANKRSGRAVAFSNSIMGLNSLALCKRKYPDYVDGGSMERKQDCVFESSTIGSDDKYDGPQRYGSTYAITYSITEGNEFLGRNRVLEFRGHPLDVVEFHFRLSPKAREEVISSGETIRGNFSIFPNKRGRQMIRRSPADILPYPADLPVRPLTCPFPDAPNSNDTTVALTTDCRPWTNLGWTELFLGAQYRTYSDAQRTGLEFQHSIKRRREILRLFPEIEIAADQYFARDKNPSILPILDKLPLNELAISGVIETGTKTIIARIDAAGRHVGRPVLGDRFVRFSQRLIPLAAMVGEGAIWVYENLTPTVSVMFTPSANFKNVSQPNAYFAYASLKPNVAKIGGDWAFFASKNPAAAEDLSGNGVPDGILSVSPIFRWVRFDPQVHGDAAKGKGGAYQSALAACGSASRVNFDGCKDNLGTRGEETLSLQHVGQFALIHRFVGPSVAGTPVVNSTPPTGVCAELPDRTASCWKGVDDTVLLEAGIDDNATPKNPGAFYSVSALVGFERPPITQFLFQFDAYKNLVCMDPDWSPDKCGIMSEKMAAALPIPARPSPPPESRSIEIFAPVQSSQSQTVSFNTGAAFVNTSVSQTRRHTDISYQDVNGDGYPEVISGGVAELTSPVGLSRRDWWRYFRVEKGRVSLGSEIYAPGMSVGAHTNSSGVGAGLSPATAALFKSHGARSDKSGSPDPNVDPSFEFSSENGYDNEFTELRDFNGDGLADSVQGKTVDDELGLSFSTGNSLNTKGSGTFTVDGKPATGIYFNTNHSAGFGVRLGFSYEGGSFAAGMGLSHRDTGSQGALLDFTGDGRPDIVVPSNDGKLVVYPNLGNGFGKGVAHEIPGWQAGATSYSETTLVDAGAQFTVGFPVPIFVKVVFTPSVKFSRNQTRELLQIRDMNGDRMPDIVTVSGAFKAQAGSILPVTDGKLTTKVHYNPDAKYYLLTGVKNPAGSEFVLRHDLVGNEGPQQGNPVWALSEVARYDGFNSGVASGLPADGQDVLLTRYRYNDGYYNRAERQFYGFATRIATVYGCDDDTSASGCLAAIRKPEDISEASLAAAGYRKLQETRDNYSNRDFLSQGLMTSEVVLGVRSGPDFAATKDAKLVPVTKTVFRYSIDDLQCRSSPGTSECVRPQQDVSSGGNWDTTTIQSSALSGRWNGSSHYGTNGNIFGAAGICKSGVKDCAETLRTNMSLDGFVREQRSFWAQQSGSVRQRLIKLQAAAPRDDDPKLDCIFNDGSNGDEPDCKDKAPTLNSAIAFDHDQWGQVITLDNIGEANADWVPVVTSSTHATIDYGRRQGPPGAPDLGYPMLGLAETIRVFNGPWSSGNDGSPIRVREAVYPDDRAENGLRGNPSDICLYPDPGAGFQFKPGICARFRDNMRLALGSGFASMQTALKSSYEDQDSGLPAGSSDFNSIIHHQLVEYDAFGNLTHAISPLSKNRDWIERRFNFDGDPFRRTATRSELTRCVQSAPGVGADSKNLPDPDKVRCTYGLAKLPELVTNRAVTHFSTNRIDTHSGKFAEVTDINANALLYDFDRWGRLRLIARQWGEAPKENRTFQQLLKLALAKSDLEPAQPDQVRYPSSWRLLALADYSCMPARAGAPAADCRSTPAPSGMLRSNMRRFESGDVYSGLINKANTTRETAAFVDGLGRQVQSVREADVCVEALPELFAREEPPGSVVEGHNVSAKAGLAERCSKVATAVVTPSSAIDVLGRDLIAFESYASKDEPPARTASEMRFQGLLKSPVQPAPLVKSTFDPAGRPLTIASRLAETLPADETVVKGTSQFRYQILANGNNPARFEALSLSPRCSASAAWSDARGLTTAVFEGQTKLQTTTTDALAGVVPNTAIYKRSHPRTAGDCLPIGSLAGDWTSVPENTAGGGAVKPTQTDYTYDELQQLNLVDYPLDETAQAHISVRYDLLGRMVQMQEPNSGCTRYSYDGLNMLTSEAGFRHEPVEDATCGTTYQPRNEKFYGYSGGRLLEMSYHSLEAQGDDPDKLDTVRFYYDRYPYADKHGELIESPKFVPNDLANQHLIDTTGRFCDNCIGQVSIVSDRTGARSFAYNELGQSRREVRSIVGPLKNVVQSAGGAETYLPEIAAYEVNNSYTAFGDLTEEALAESAPANPAEACVKAGIDTCLARFTIGRRYSPDGAIAELTFNGKAMVHSAQDALGRPAVRWTSNGTTTGYRYDSWDLRLNQMSTLTGANEPVQSVGYQYDGGGNILDYENRALSSRGYRSAFAFNYDAINRLIGFNSSVEAIINNRSKSMTSDGVFVYDAGHRFVSRSLYIHELARPDFSRSWVYASNNDPGKGPVQAPASVAFTVDGKARNTSFGFDQMGRMTQIRLGDGGDRKAVPIVSNRTMSWDAEGRLVRVRGIADDAIPSNDNWVREQYIYDFAGNRTLKIHQPNVAKDGNSSVPQPANVVDKGQPKPDEMSDLVESATIYMTPYYARPYDGRGAVELSVGSLPTASMTAPADESEDPVATYLYADLPVGSVTASVTAFGESTDQAATVIARREYDPYGLPLTADGLAATGRDSVAPLSAFHGKELDRVTGFSSFGARYYNRDTGIWLSPDPVLYGYLSKQGTGEIYSLQNLDSFGFARKNPIVNGDPDGNEPKYVAWSVRLTAEGFEWVARVTRQEAIALRRTAPLINETAREGQVFNVVADSRKLSQQIEVSAAQGGNILKHEAHPGIPGARPHFQTAGKQGHSFWGLAGTPGAADFLDKAASVLGKIGEALRDPETNFPNTYRLLCITDPWCVGEKTMELEKANRQPREIPRDI